MLRAIGRAVRLAQPKGTQYITGNYVPNGTSRALGDTFFYQYFVPNGTLLRRFWNEFLKNETHIFYTPACGTIYPHKTLKRQN